MFTKRRIIQFIAIAVLFLAAMGWIYHQLSVSFREYAEQFLAPEKPDIPLAELYRQSGLRSIEESLKGNPKIRVIHNYDDFLRRMEHLRLLYGACGYRYAPHPFAH